MDSRQLQYFRMVVDHGSFTHAAEQLQLTQPSLSLSVRRLEEHLKVKLLSRGRGGVKTTEAGDYLYGIATSIDALLNSAETRLAEMAAGTAGSVTVSCAPEFTWLFMPEALRRMRMQAPEVSISLNDLDASSTLSHVTDGSIEIGIVLTTDAAGFTHRYNDRLSIHRVCDIDLCVALPERLAHLPEPLSLTALTQETWLLPPQVRELRTLPDALKRLWSTHPGYAPTSTQEVSSLQTALPLVAGDFGISLMPYTAQAFSQAGVHFRRVQEPLPAVQALLIHRANHALSPAASTFVDVLLNTDSPAAATPLANI